MICALASFAIALRPESAVYLHVLPMVLLVSVIWGATRHEHWPDILGHALRFAAMVLVFMAGVLGFLLVAPLFPWYVWAGLVVAVILYFRLSRPHQEPAKQ